MPRQFDFPLRPEQSMAAMLETIAAALDDEGLQLLPRPQGYKVSDVIVNRTRRLTIPDWLIVPKLREGVGVTGQPSTDPGPLRTGMTESGLMYAYRNTDGSDVAGDPELDETWVRYRNGEGE